MLYDDKIEIFKEDIDKLPEEMADIVKNAKELPTENIESLLHIKSIIRHMMRTL